NQQALGLAIDRFAHRTPPSPDALDGKGGRVVVNTHAHPASILAHVVDAIRSDPSQLGNDEVMDPHRLRASLESKLSTPVFEVPHQLLLLSIDRDDTVDPASGSVGPCGGYAQTEHCDPDAQSLPESWRLPAGYSPTRAATRLPNGGAADHFCLRSFFATESALLAVLFS